MSQPNSPAKPSNITEMGKILSSLANEDAIKVFLAARRGITKSTRTIEELGLTQKRYYTRLKELIKAGLVEKRDDTYQLTTIGTVCFTLGETFNTALDQRDRLDLADRLRRTQTISLEETKQILQAISSKGIIGSLGVADIIQPVKMINTYEDIVSELVIQIDGAEKNIYLASYYTDSRVIEALLRASQRGLMLSILSGSKKSKAEKLKMLRVMLSPKTIESYSTLFDEKTKITYSEFPYSFCVTDERFVVVELSDPITKAFYTAFSVQSETLSQRLIKAFEIQYEKDKEHPIHYGLRKETRPPNQLEMAEAILSKYY